MLRRRKKKTKLRYQVMNNVGLLLIITLLGVYCCSETKTFQEYHKKQIQSQRAIKE